MAEAGDKAGDSALRVADCGEQSRRAFPHLAIAGDRMRRTADTEAVAGTQLLGYEKRGEGRGRARRTVGASRED